MSTLSFIVCAYKESPYLRECVESLKNQSVPCDIKLSTSTPNSAITDVASAFSLPLLVHDHTSSIAADWNSAYQAADSDFVVLAHQDDVYEPDYARTALDALQKAAKPLLFFTDYYEIRNGRVVRDPRNREIKRRLLRPLGHSAASSERIKRKILSLGNPICCPSVTYVRKNLPQVPFHPGMQSNLDWDAWERFSRLEGEFIYSTKQLVGHRVHEASATSGLIEGGRRTGEDLEMLKRFWPAPVASVINHFYRKAEASNALYTDTLHL